MIDGFGFIIHGVEKQILSSSCSFGRIYYDNIKSGIQMAADSIFSLDGAAFFGPGPDGTEKESRNSQEKYSLLAI
jgi:hypothetical protein